MVVGGGPLGGSQQPDGHGAGCLVAGKGSQRTPAATAPRQMGTYRTFPPQNEVGGQWRAVWYHGAGACKKSRLALPVLPQRSREGVEVRRWPAPRRVVADEPMEAACGSQLRFIGP